MLTFYQQKVFAPLEKNQANEFFSPFLQPLAFLSIRVAHLQLATVTRDNTQWPHKSELLTFMALLVFKNPV